MLSSILLACTAATLLPEVAFASPIEVYKPWLQARQAVSPAPNGTTSNNATWSWTSGRKMNGINLGNWLVLEKWMDPQWFESSSGDPAAADEWTWSQALGSRAKDVLTEHWNTWITDSDIQLIAESGFNHIRIPIGYWAFINQPAGTPYVSQGGQVEQLTRVLDSANKYGLYAIIDLHGLPGSQNGEQPSGHIGYNNFYQPQNQNYSDATIDAIIAYVNNSTNKHMISAVAACNEPVFYTQDQYQTLVGFYERTYAKLSTMNPPMPMMFHPGHPQTNAMALWQGFINGKNPSLLIYEDHPYPGRLQATTSQTELVNQVCTRAQSYASYGVPVAVTEWCLSSAIWNNSDWDHTFYSTQARAWAQSAGGVFWSYRVNALPYLANMTENLTLYSWIDLRNNNVIPLPAQGQDANDYLLGFDACNFQKPNKTWPATVSSISPSVTAAITKRALAEVMATPAP